MYILHYINLVKWLKGKTGAFVPTLIWLETPDHLKLLCFASVKNCGVRFREQYKHMTMG
jgi:hypothetical protein